MAGGIRGQFEYGRTAHTPVRNQQGAAGAESRPGQPGERIFHDGSHK